METHSNSLFREGHMVVQYILTQFLDFKTMARFKCCCRFTKECIEEYEKTWEGRFKALEGKYRIDLSDCEKAIADKKPEDKFRILPENERMLYQTNQMYRHKDFRHVFRMFCGDNQVATMAEKRDGWAHTDNPSYFSVATRHDSIFTEKMPELIDVCWYDPSCTINDVLPEKYTYYTIYVRHLVKQYNSIKRTLKIFVDGKAFYPAEDGKEDIKKTFSIHEETDFPKMTNLDSGEEYPYDKFFNQKICEIDLTEYQDAKRIDISFGWRHNNNYWKSGYIIDGVLLMPSEVTPTEESMPTIEKFLSE